MTITKAEKSARKKQCGTENPDRARSWISAVNALEWAQSPVDVLTADREAQRRMLGGSGIALCAEDFMRSFPHRPGFDGRKREDLEAIRHLLVEAFDLSVLG
jgi:hypothetical protein